MSKKKSLAREVQPMNKRRDPITWPTAKPSALSEDARILYRGGRQLKLDRDPFDPRAQPVHPSGGAGRVQADRARPRSDR